MTDKVIYTADYSNDSVTGLFDRIINIKFTRKNGTSFTVRSDYETVWQGNSLYFKTCSPKPEIRVKYTQYQATIINVDIYITNLNILEPTDIASYDMDDPAASKESAQKTTNQPNEMLYVRGNPIVSAEIEMGYRGQFHNWSQETPTKLNQDEMYAAFLDLKLPNNGTVKHISTDSQLFFKQMRKCTVQVEWAANISNPPDRVTQFHGFVGSTSAGFQPFSMVPLDDRGRIKISDVYKGLNDNYNTIEMVESVRKIATKKKRFITKKYNTYRNFFNGGKGFTLLEACCFHAITRRFVRSDAPVQRSEFLEKAALDYALATSHDSNPEFFTAKRFKIAQALMTKEMRLNPTYFELDTEKDIIVYTASMPEKEKEILEAYIDDKMIEHYVGARFTVKDLPEHRSLYSKLRSAIKTANTKGVFLSWWDAAKQVSGTGEATTTSESIEKTVAAARTYLLSFESGGYKSKDAYFPNVLGKDWILPLQVNENAIPLTDKNGKAIKYSPPKATNSTGFDAGTSEKTLSCFAGMLEVRDAYMFGVPVLCSDLASEIFQKKHDRRQTIDLKFLSNSQAQVNYICKTYGFKYYTLQNGGFYIYTASETERDVAGQDFVTNQSANTPFVVPAVYDVTLTPLRKLRMPFVAFLNPMTILEWNSSATIGSMISYYFQPEVGRNFFLTIRNEIDFSTTGEQNEMLIEMVDSQYTDKTEVPEAVLTQDSTKYYLDTIIVPDSKLNTWQKIYKSPAGKISPEMYSLWPETKEDGKDLVKGYVSPAQFYTMMLQFNPSLFAQSTKGSSGWHEGDGVKRVDKKADAVYRKGTFDEKVHFPNITYCLPWLENSKMERIYMKFPFMPNASDYSNMKNYNSKYVLVYENGTWEMLPKTEVQTRFSIGEL